MTERPDAETTLDDLSTPDRAPDADPENAAEELDEDRLGIDPLEEGVEPPERYSGADRFGTTAWEQEHGQDLEHRLREERPDVTDSEIEGPSGAGAAAPAGSSDLEGGGRPLQPADEQLETIVDDTTGYESADAEPELSDAARRGQSADEAGGAIAETVRTPDDEET